MSGIEWRGYEIRLLVIICGIFGTFYSANVSAATYSASISTSTSLSIDASNVGNGTSVGVDNLTVTSTCPSGYNITIEGPSDTNLYLNGDSSNNASGTYIAHSNGTPSNPVSIAGTNLGTWGYSTTSSTGTGNFIGLTNSATTLYSKNSASASGGDSIPVYYGVSVPATMAPGTYQMPGTSSITYYLTTSESCFSYTVSFNANGGSGTTMANQTIYEDITTPLSSNTYTPPNNYVFKEWNTATDGSGISYTDGQTVTNIAAVGTTLPLYAIWERDYCDENPDLLYCKVAVMSRGTQTVEELRSAITTSNSGVYEYNSDLYGTSNDANNDKKIYYYRGILDENTGTYGSDGDGEEYPNYVILQTGNTKSTIDTCWRIVRTTGSGGVKMIYNGKWTGTTCANSTTNAQITTSPFDIVVSSTGKAIIGVGYSNSKSSYTSDQTYNRMFMENSCDEVMTYGCQKNSSDSTIKTLIDETWFSTIVDYESIIEPSAGYCNDRTMNTTDSWTTPMSGSTNIIAPTTTSTSGNTEYYFGAYIRNNTTTKTPSLSCSRYNADHYTNQLGSNGNKILYYAIGLLTADEASFAGSGNSSNTTPYNNNSFLNSGSEYWLLSPNSRTSDGYANVFSISSNGNLRGRNVNYENGVRPVISLLHETIPESGAGTATNPWVIKPPTKTYMQETTLNYCMKNVGTNGNSSGVGDIVLMYDNRDEIMYGVRYINGNCWMVQNLQLTGGEGTVTLSNTDSNISTTYTIQAETNENFTGSYPNYPGYRQDGHICNSGHFRNKGCWYNYYSATAGTISGNGNNNTIATEDICPYGWKLPSRTQGMSLDYYGEYFIMAYTGWQDSGNLINRTTGAWWTTERSSGTNRYVISSSSTTRLSVGGMVRYMGFTIRCVKKP